MMTDQPLNNSERLITVARRFAAIKQANPELSNARILNRLHAEGIACEFGDVIAGDALIASSPALSGMTVKQIATEVGATSKQVKAWFDDPPDDFPPFSEAPKRGVVRYFIIDTALVKAWMSTHA